MYKKIIWSIVELISLPYLLTLALYWRYARKPFDIGIGPEPMIDSIYCKKALSQYHYNVRTFTTKPYYITAEFDLVTDNFCDLNKMSGKIRSYFYMASIAFEHRILYFRFHGGVFYNSTWIRVLEP